MLFLVCRWVSSIQSQYYHPACILLWNTTFRQRQLFCHRKSTVSHFHSSTQEWIRIIQNNDSYAWSCQRVTKRNGPENVAAVHLKKLTLHCMKSISQFWQPRKEIANRWRPMRGLQRLLIRETKTFNEAEWSGIWLCCILVVKTAICSVGASCDSWFDSSTPTLPLNDM